MTGRYGRYARFMLVFALFLNLGRAGASGTPEEKTLHLYLDADFTSAVASSTAIEQGMRTALDEAGGRVGGFIIKIVKKDHRGNSRRSRDNMKAFLGDSRGLAVFAGLHSPPLLNNLEFINENGVLLLVPWAAAGPITRWAGGTNWVFRLSIDDTKAGAVLVDHAVKAGGMVKPALLLEATGWGRSNAVTMTRALEFHGLSPAGIFRFNWGTKAGGARIILRNIVAKGADSILLVANSPEGKVFAGAMADLPEEMRLPFFSHWGITGGDFPEVIHRGIREKIDLTFLQTSFSFVTQPDHPLGKRVLNRAGALFPGVIEGPADILAPAGFIHAYDLTKILIAALNRAAPSGDAREDRKRIRNALETLDEPVEGLIRTYARPFSPFDPAHPDAHEALGREDFTMGYYGEDNEIILLAPPSGRSEP